MKRSIAQLPISPSSTLVKFAGTIAASGSGLVLDAGCGFGRNAIALAAQGCTVICVDNDLRRLRMLDSVKAEYLAANAAGSKRVGEVITVCADLRSDRWLFTPGSFSAVVCVHFVKMELLPYFSLSLWAGGYLYIETFGGQGGNYVDLPKAGQVRGVLGDYEFIHYVEKRVVVMGT